MSAPPEGFDELLAHLKTQRGFDFTGYKTAGLERRFAKRMSDVGVETYAEYLDHLEVHPSEFGALFNTILINVTGFFRDHETWDFVRSDVIPRLLEGKDPGTPIRVWSAGCASGEEPYTIAMLLAEALGADEYTRRVKIYGTDVDEEALEQARLGVYEQRLVEGVPDDLRERYFDRTDDHLTFRKDLRRTLIFGRNDLVQDAPISRVDLLVCRNTLMYFNAETQGHILRRFHFALQASGYLVLGKSEMLLTRSELFLPVNLKRRVFTKALRKPSQRLASAGDGGTRLLAAEGAGALVDAAFDTAPVAQLVVRQDGILAMANRAARRLLGLSASDVGRPLKDLEASYRPAELRAGIDSVFTEGRVVMQGPVDHGAEGRTLEVRIEPVVVDGRRVAASVTFTDVSAERRVQEELDRSRRELGNAYEELQSTVEELETTNEELETTNEELQSTNEELETTNEELQSSNEEFETTNEELRQRSFALDRANAVMETTLAGIGAAVFVLDDDQRVRMWNAGAEDLWGLREGEVLGEHLMALDSGLPVEALRPAVRDALAPDGAPAELAIEAIDRRGRTFLCALTVVPLRVEVGRPTGAVVLARRAGERP
jgi:two-component system CheB/CheR fusion protein